MTKVHVDVNIRLKDAAYCRILFLPYRLCNRLLTEVTKFSIRACVYNSWLFFQLYQAALRELSEETGLMFSENDLNISTLGLWEVHKTVTV